MALKKQLGYREIEDRLKLLKNGTMPASDIGYYLLYSFGKSNAEIRRYRQGKSTVRSFDGLLIRGLFCFRSAETSQLQATLDSLKGDTKVINSMPKIIAVSDGVSLLAYDTREKESYENPVNRIYCDFTFFYPLMNEERVHNIEESPADLKAAEKLARLHDELRVYNDFSSDTDLHDLNLFITRLLFCFFAEDTGIFEHDLFTQSIERWTKVDGSNLADYLNETFNIMDVRSRSKDTPSIILQFPYVNGGLFHSHIQIPKIGYKARKIILECGELDWADINPDIFGSMFQAVVNPELRATEGMHYTSVPNIMKVINPLFLDELRGEYNRLYEIFRQQNSMLQIGGISEKDFEKVCDDIVKSCNKLRLRMSRMKFFDPACGSGNFLIITYKCLRLLEMNILKLIQLCRSQKKVQQSEIDFIDGSDITIDQFYGIELEDFPHEVAMLSLWLAQHQMDNKFHNNFGVNVHALPLQNIKNIVCGNACRMDWEKVCPHNDGDEVFIFGNPPYKGSKKQNPEQKKDIKSVFHNATGSSILDYIAIWFLKGAQYIKSTKAKCAFVSTNSICQGEQVGALWPLIYGLDVDIQFAYTSFKWSNNAKNNATVTCIIIGLADKKQIKWHYLFDGNRKLEVNAISAYLTKDSKTIVKKKTSDPIGLPKLCFGCMPYDDRNNKYLRLSKEDRDRLIEGYPQSKAIIRRMYGADEFIKGNITYCLWIDDNQLALAESIPPIRERIDRNKNYRLYESTDGQSLADRPHQFREHPEDAPKIIIPRVSSEERQYIPMGVLPKEVIVSDSAFSLYNAPIWLLGILTSAMHMAWVRAVGGKLETRYRYSAGLCYNPFPFAKLNGTQKSKISSAIEDILLIREDYPDKTLADLYDPETMPSPLREAHSKLDDLVDSCYPGYPFASDEDRLECLFKLYEKTIKDESHE